MAALDDFARQLLDEQLRRNGTSVLPAVRVEMEAELVDRAQDFLNRRLIDAMSEEATARFIAVVESPGADEQQVQTFIAQNVPNAQNVATAALVEFRELYLGIR